MNLKKFKVYFWLFYINVFISSFTFGGGYVVIPMVRKYFIKNKKLINEQELMEIAAIAQSSPGAIAVNLSILAGYKIAKMKGAIISCVASVLPPIIILSLISSCYDNFRDYEIISSILKGMEAGVCVLIIDLVFDMAKTIFKEKNFLFSAIIPLAFIFNFFFKINVIFIIAASILLCLAESYIKMKKKGKKLL